MRLQLIVICALAAVPPSAHAQDAEPDRQAGDGAVTVKSSAYTDDDDTIVATEMLDGELQLSPALLVGGHLLVDGISSASVDVVSAATRGFNEVRTETALRGAYAGPGGAGLALNFVRSSEEDWVSHAVQATAGKDLARKNARVQLGYGFTHNVIGRAYDDTFDKRLLAHTLEAGATQLLDERTLVGLSYTLQLADGYQASPYRYVGIGGGGVSVPEHHPASRRRHAGTLRTLRALYKSAALDAAYRLYGDDWGVVSHTLSLSLNLALSPRWDLRVRGRFYRQGAADFWQASYSQEMAYMSADRELSTFWDAAGGAKLAATIGRFTLDAKSDLIYYRFQDYTRLAGRLALVTELGVRLAW